MTDTNQASEDEKLARLFHDIYECLAPEFSYKTRKASAVPWADVPSKNKDLMIAVAHEINDAIRTEKLKLLDEVRERVVGTKDLKLSDIYGDDWRNTYGYTETQVRDAANHLQRKQLESLTKLEAEL